MLSIILKGTNSCNLACSYCSLGKKNSVVMTTKKKMYEIMKYSCELCMNLSEKEICFILHGGEPTLIDYSIYDNAIAKIKNEYKELVIEILMQTNGYSLSEEWMDFFDRHNVSVGVSIDGVASIHDTERNTINGKATFDVIQNNIKNLRKRGIKVSCLMVLTSNALKEKYDFINFYSKNKLHLKINPLLDYGEVYEHPELSLKSGQYANYLIGMYEYILSNDIEVCVSPIDKIIQGILYNDKKIKECSFNKNCNQHFLCIDYKGDIYPCGKFSDMNKYCIGNISDKNYEVFNSLIISKLLDRRSKLKPEKCIQCKFVSLCNAGCNAEACINGSLNQPPAMCNDYFKLFEYFTGRGLILLKEELKRQRKKLKGLNNDGI